MAEEALDSETDLSEETSDDFEDSLDVGQKKRGIDRRLIIMIALPVILAIGGAGAYFSGVLDGGGEAPVEAEKVEAPPEKSAFYDLPDLLVNLNTPGRKSTFLKISVSLEIGTDVDIKRLEAVMPRIVDNFQVYLRELRIEDLRGSAGLHRLREELLTRVNAAVQPVKVKDVLFRQMLVQ